MQIKALMFGSLILSGVAAQAQSNPGDVAEKQRIADEKQKAARDARDWATQLQGDCGAAKARVEYSKGTRQEASARENAEAICAQYESDLKKAEQLEDEAKEASREADAAIKLAGDQMTAPVNPPAEPPEVELPTPLPQNPQPQVGDIAPKPVTPESPKTDEPSSSKEQVRRAPMKLKVDLCMPNTRILDTLEAYAGQIKSQVDQLNEVIRSVEQMSMTIEELASQSVGQENEASVRAAASTAAEQLLLLQDLVQQYQDEVNRTEAQIEENRKDSSEWFGN